MEETQTTESTNVDNSTEYTDEQISAALEEPTNDVEETTGENHIGQTDDKGDVQQEQKDNGQTIDCPDKFKNEDGSVNVGNLAKSYKELEKLNSQKSEWEKERAELLQYKDQVEKANQAREQEAQKAGYESYQDYTNSKEIAYLEANEYAKYLQYTEEPEVVRQMLIDYANNPNEEAMREIELEFSPEVNKNVAILSERQKAQYAQQKKTYEETKRMTGIEAIVQQSVDNYREFFDNDEFQDMFVSALQNGNIRSYEDAEMLFKAINAMAGSYKDQVLNEKATTDQNNKATDKLAAITNKSSAPAASQNIDIDSMSDAELAKAISKYI